MLYTVYNRKGRKFQVLADNWKQVAAICPDYILIIKQQ